MKPIPNIGEYYHFWDDGKTSLGRHYICQCERIIPFYGFTQYRLTRFDYDRNELVEDTLISLWKNSVSDFNWIFAEQTDCAVVCSCPKYDKDELYFFRTRSGGWFSADRTSSWQAGELDVDGEKFRRVTDECLSEETRREHEEKTY